MSFLQRLRRMITAILSGGGGTRPVPPTIGIGTEISDASIEVVEGGAAVDVVVTLYRSGGYTGTVTLGTTSLPSGVSVSYPDGQTYTGGTTTRTVRFTAADGATPIINDAATVTAEGADVTTSVTNITVTVLAGEAEPETIAIAPDDDTVSVPQGGSVVITYTLARGGGYTGTVTLAIAGLPTGVTASLLDGATWTGSATTLRVQLTAAGDASTVSNDSFTATASGSGVTDATDNGTVSVTAAIDPDEFAASEPVGYTLLGDTTWDSFTPGDGWDATNTYQLRPPAITNEPGPYAPTSIRFTNEAGMDDGGFGIIDKSGTPSGGVEELYFAFAIKPQPGYLMHTWQTKIVYPYRYTSGTTSATQDFIFGTRRAAAGQYYWWLGTQSGPGLASNYYDNQNGYSQQSPLILNADQWVRVELQVIHNTPGVKNGIARWWISTWNGSAWSAPVLAGQHTDVAYSQAANPGKWTRPRWNLHHGGSPMPALANPQNLWINRTRISYKENS